MPVQAQLRHQLRLPLTEISREPTPDKPLDVEGTLDRLLGEDLTFEGMKTIYGPHNIHTFAAKFPPQLPRLFVHNLTCPGERVLDPMAGSGTALVEAVLGGRHAIGVDLDPLAVLIAKVKTTPIDLVQCTEVGTSILQKAKEKLHSARGQDLFQFYSPQAVDFFRYWFDGQTIIELHALAQEIKKVDHHDIRSFLSVVFSSVIITKTGGVTRARDLAHSRPHRDPNKKKSRSAFLAFRERLHQAVGSIANMLDATGHALVVRADARKLPLADNSVHLIVTSPPYAANAIDYIRSHKFSLMWFGYAPKALANLRREYVGAELRSSRLGFRSQTANRVLQAIQREDERRAAVVAHYFQDAEAVLRAMLRVLAEGRAAILVVGSSTIRGVGIRAPTVFAELADAVGFHVVGVARREIIRNARMMPVSHTSKRTGIEARMHEEGVIGLIKPRRGSANAVTRRDSEIRSTIPRANG